jgi:hypothetical protein
MIKKLIQKIPSNNLSYALLYGGILLLVILLGIIPLYQYNYNRSQAVKKIQSQIDEQKELGQAYQAMRKDSEKKEVHHLPNPAKTKLSRQDIDRFQDSFRAEAAKSGMNTLSLMPDVKTMAGGSQSVLYTATVKGAFANFRKLLMGLGTLSYIEIDEINMNQSSNSMEFQLKIWIALAN